MKRLTRYLTFFTLAVFFVGIFCPDSYAKKPKKSLKDRIKPGWPHPVTVCPICGAGQEEPSEPPPGGGATKWAYPGTQVRSVNFRETVITERVQGQIVDMPSTIITSNMISDSVNITATPLDIATLGNNGVYGGSSTAMDMAESIQQTLDGGYIARGHMDGKQTVIKLNPDGSAQWAMVYNELNAYAESTPILRTQDGGYIMLGMGYGMTTTKLYPDGTIQWSKAYREQNKSAQGLAMHPTQDGGYILAGTTGDDILLTKIDSSGTLQWSTTYGGNTQEYPRSVQQTPDGGYIVATQATESLRSPTSNLLVTKLDSGGTAQWSRVYGESGSHERPLGIQQTQDGGYIVVGDKGNNALFIKIDSAGTTELGKTYSATSIQSIQKTQDGGFILAGGGSQVPIGGRRGVDAFLMKLNQDGTTDWTKMYGGRRDDCAFSAQQTQDGGYVMAGYTNSFGAGREDFYIIKTDENGGIE